MAKTLQDQVNEILDAPYNGHPSRNLEEKVNRLERVVKILIDGINAASWPN